MRLMGRLCLIGEKMSYLEYLEFVLQTATSNIKPGQAQITAAALGTLLLQSSPNVTWKGFDKRSLTELLNDPWFQGKLELGETDKGALAVSPVGHQVHSGPSLIETFNPLRKAMWEVFVLTSPSGRRYVSRIDGSIRLGQEIAPTPADNWVEVQPVSNDQQFEWACEFSKDHADQLKTEPERQGWTPHVFNSMLKQEHESLAPLWNRYRSARVSQVVQEWLTKHSLPRDFAFQRSGGLGAKTKQTAASAGHHQLELSPEETKQVLLCALSSLPLDKLLDIPLPPRLIFEALSKSKTR